MNAVFVSPHDDDHVLFGAFTLLREQPIVLIVFDGHLQGKRGLPITAAERALETELSCRHLCTRCSGGNLQIERLGFRDDDPTVTPEQIRSRAGQVVDRLVGKEIFAPAFEEHGHGQHNLVASAFGMRDPQRPEPGVTYYLTYTRQVNGKTISAREVPILEPGWIGRKLGALACFQTQFLPAAGCVDHFIGRSLREYYL